MKNRFLTRIFSVIALLVVSLIAVGCAVGGETSPARDKAKEQVNNLLNIDFAETKDNVVLEPVTGNVAIATDSDGIVSEKDLANNSYSEFAGGVVAEYSSSHPEIMDAKWVEAKVRDYQYAEDGTTVIGITKKSVYSLVFVVNRPAEDTKVTITITGSKVYEDQGIEYKYTKSREIVFTVKAKEQLEAVEMTIAEINEYANSNWDSFTKNGIVDAEGNKVQVVTTGVVTEVLWGDGYTNHSFMISDGEESFYVYAPKGDVVELGDLVQVVCTPTYYYSIIETAQGPQVTVLLNGQDVPTAKEYTVDEWYAAYPNGSDFHDCPGQRVAITGVLKHNGTNYILESSETGKKFEVYYKGYTAYEESLIKANLGKLVKMEASIYDYHSQGYYRLLANVYDYPMQVMTLSGQAALDADASTITTQFTVKEGETISLPTSFPNGSTLSAWTADKEGHINLNTLVCTLGSAKEDVTVTLTATLSNGSYSTTVTVVVKLDYVAPAQKEYEVVTNLELGVPYKYVVNQETIGKVLYFAGALDSQGKYLTSTEAASDGVDVYLEAAAGGYYMYFLNAGVKTYINMAADGSKLALEAAPSNVWVYNAQYNTLFTNVADKEYFVGMYSSFETFSRSQTSYLSNAGNFAAQFYAEKGGSQTPETPEVPEGQISLKEAIEIASKQEHNTYTTEKYTVTGTVSDLYNTVYGNMHLIDAEGNDLTIYGLYMNGVRYDAMENKPVEGDVITVTGILGTYNGKPQMKNAELVVSTPEVPSHEHTACPTCGKCTAEDCTGAAEDKCAGHVVEPELPEGQISLKEAIEIASKQEHNTYTSEKYTVTGTVSDLYNTVYGNMHLIDAEGNDLTIYGLYMNGVRYDAMENKPVEGDVITVNGILGTYNGKPQMKNAELVVSTPEVPSHEHTACPTCGKCTAEDCTGEKCEGHTETPDTPEVPSESTTVSVSIADYAAANGWANSTMYNTLTMNDKVTVTMSAVAGSGSYPANTGKYYATGSTWRAYQSDTEATIVVEASGLTIVSVKFTYAAQNNGSIVFNGQNFATDEVVNVNATSATFTIGNTGSATNGQARITAIEVVYGAAGSSEPEVPTTCEHEGGQASCKAQAVCTKCGEAYGELADHVWDDRGYSYNEEKHWVDCVICQAAKNNEAAHDFTSGNCVCGKEAPTQPEIPADGKITLAQAIEIASKQAHNTYTTEKYTVTGTVSDLYNTVYGNMHLIDAEGNDLTIYGLYMNGVRYDAMENKPVEGDVITVTGILGTYNGKPQMKNAELVVTPAEPEVPTHEHVACPTCGKCTAEDCTGADEEKCAGHVVEPELPEGQISLKEAVEIASKQAHNTYTTEKYTVTGTVSDLYNTVYGNMHLIDAEGNDLTIYGLYMNGVRYDAMENKPVEGDVITVTGILGTYNGTPQMKNAELVVSTPEVPSHEHTACPTCGKCTAEDCTGAEDEKCAGHEVAPEEPVVAGGKADLETFNNGVHSSSYADRQSANGWTATFATVNKGSSDPTSTANPQFGFLGDESVYATTIDGGTDKVGTLVSPVLTGGLSKLTFNYTNLFTDTKFSITLTIKTVDGVEIYSEVIAYDNPDKVKYEVRTYEKEFNVQGDFVIEFVNNCPNGLTGNKDRATLWNIEWLGASEVEPETPEVPTHEHTVCAECGKCTAEDCTGTDEEKCAGHPVHEHVACETCGKCTTEDCTGTDEEKCAGHEVVAPTETTYVLDCAANFGTYASAWDSSYKARTITFAQLGVADLAGSLVLSNANKQTSTITDRPVMASKSSATQYATVSVESGTISSVTFTLAQWTTKKFKTLTIEYSTDGTNWVATNVGVVNGSAVQADAHSPLTATLPEGVVAVRFAFLGSTTSNNQIGLTSVEFTHKA